MSDEKLPACILVVLVEIDASAEAAWNEWYDNVHLPEALACPGVLSGRRYRSASEVSLTDHGASKKSRLTSATLRSTLSHPKMPFQRRNLSGWPAGTILQAKSKHAPKCSIRSDT